MPDMILIASTAGCPKCVLLKNELKKRNMSFRDISDEIERNEIVKNSGLRSFPIMLKNGMYFAGEDALKEIRGY